MDSKTETGVKHTAGPWMYPWASERLYPFVTNVRHYRRATSSPKNCIEAHVCCPCGSVATICGATGDNHRCECCGLASFWEFSYSLDGKYRIALNMIDQLEYPTFTKREQRQIRRANKLLEPRIDWM